MGRAIPPECTVNLLSLGKEPWKLKDLEDQLNVYRQQWQADQQKQIIAQMSGTHPNKSNDRKRKKMIEIITIPMADAVVIAMETLLAEDTEDVEEAAVIEVGEETIVSIYRMSNVSIVARKATIPLTVPSQERIKNERSNMVSKEDFKNLFQTSMK
jgi:hypothetical protein